MNTIETKYLHIIISSRLDRVSSLWLLIVYFSRWVLPSRSSNALPYQIYKYRFCLHSCLDCRMSKAQKRCVKKPLLSWEPAAMLWQRTEESSTMNFLQMIFQALHHEKVHTYLRYVLNGNVPSFGSNREHHSSEESSVGTKVRHWYKNMDTNSSQDKNTNFLKK